MNEENKAYVEKVNAQLNQIKTELKDYETLAKAKDEKVAIDIVGKLRRTHQDLEKKRETVARSAVKDIEEERDAIDDGIVTLKEGLTQLATRLKSGPHTKAG